MGLSGEVVLVVGVDVGLLRLLLLLLLLLLCNIHAYPGHVSEIAAKGLVEPYQGT